MELYNYNEQEYGEQYKDHLLEQWKTAVEMSSSLSDRRTNSNNIFTTINTILIAILTFKIDQKNVLFGVVGIIICISWICSLENYKKLSSVKFNIINKLEKKLPVNLFDYEWELVGRGQDKKKYKKMSKIEMFIPYVFIVIYLIAIVYPFLKTILIK